MIAVPMTAPTNTRAYTFQSSMPRFYAAGLEDGSGILPTLTRQNDCG